MLTIISVIESVGFHVVATVSDLGPSNQGLKKLGITPSQPYFQNPVYPTENVYVFVDVPHLIKLIRNNLVDSGFNVDGVPINKSIIEELISETNYKSELSISYKISKDNLNVRGPGRRKVKTVAKLFSHTIS